MSETQIIRLPSFWLNQKEKEYAFRTLFTQKEKETVDRYGLINQKLFEKAKVIVVDLLKPDGFLGDTIRDSRLTGVINQFYPDKLVLAWSRYPQLLGKLPFITKIRNDKKGLSIYFQKAQDLKEEKISIDSREVIRIVKTSPRFSGAFPAVYFNQDYPKGIVFHEMPLYHLHLSQIVWERLYNIGCLDCLPDPSIKISAKDSQEGKKLFRSLSGKKPTRAVIFHPDAHQNYFKQKSWPLAKWVKLIKLLGQQNPHQSLFLSTGASHPRLSQKIAERCLALKLPIIKVPLLPLPQYVGFLKCFSPTQTVFVGLESAIGTHLAPGLGFKSVIIASDEVFNPLIYGPLGGIVVMSDDHQTASVETEKVIEAVCALFFLHPLRSNFLQ